LESKSNPMDKLMALKNKRVRRIVGLMSGTSADGVSSVLAEIEGSWVDIRFRILAHENYPYSKEVREIIFQAFESSQSTVDKICYLNFLLGEIFAEAALKVIEKARLKVDEVDLIASHGQTVYHMPNPLSIAGYSLRSTLQIGEPSVIAERTGLPVIADFRTRDVAAGGQGAPISAYVDYILFRSKEKNIAVQNIGGIANVTFIPKGGSLDEVIAFDTGPGNMMIDAAVKYFTRGLLSYDVDGKLSMKGKVNNELLSELMKHPFLKKKPPKTTGREEFGEHYTLSLINKFEWIRPEDFLATVTYFTVKCITLSYEEFLPSMPDVVILGGGGVFNKSIIKMLSEELPEVDIKFHEEYGIPSTAKEALTMAILANEVINGVCNNVPSATGARKRVIMGKIVLGNTNF